MKDRWELLYSFGQPLDAAFPGADLIQDEPDSLYGTTLFGGAYGYGTVFQFNLTTRVETVLYNFTGGQDGAEPRAPLIRDHAGIFTGPRSAVATSRAIRQAAEPYSCWTRAATIPFCTVSREGRTEPTPRQV